MKGKEEKGKKEKRKKGKEEKRKQGKKEKGKRKKKARAEVRTRLGTTVASIVTPVLQCTVNIRMLHFY